MPLKAFEVDTVKNFVTKQWPPKRYDTTTYHKLNLQRLHSNMIVESNEKDFE